MFLFKAPPSPLYLEMDETNLIYFLVFSGFQQEKSNEGEIVVWSLQTFYRKKIRSNIIP